MCGEQFRPPVDRTSRTQIRAATGPVAARTASRSASVAPPSMVTRRPAEMLRLKDYGLAVGKSPDGRALKFIHRGSYDAMDTTYEAIAGLLPRLRTVDRFSLGGAGTVAAQDPPARGVGQELRRILDQKLRVDAGDKLTRALATFDDMTRQLGELPPLTLKPTFPRFTPENRQANQGFVDWLGAFAARAREKSEVVPDAKNPNLATLSVGDGDWPLPIPIVRKAGKWFSAEEAADYIGGYVIFNDLTARDIQRGGVRLSGIWKFVACARDSVVELSAGASEAALFPPSTCFLNSTAWS